jgi:general secretion pathway protein A
MSEIRDSSPPALGQPREGSYNPPRLLKPRSALASLLDFFGLKQDPFGVTPDPSFLYLSATHREALASMMYGIEADRGFLALIAQPGMGKTTLLFHLLEQFRNSARSALLFQTQCSSREFMHLLMAELGYETEGYDFVRMHDEFNQHLLREAEAGKRCIIIVDEAQNLDASVLETLRLLSNFETPHAKLLQIILAGQPELGDKLRSNSMAQLRQRLSLINRLDPFSADEAERYIFHRLRVSGYAGRSLLTPAALAIVTQFSKGIPRCINTFCFNALTLAFALRHTVIDKEIAQEVVSDLEIWGARPGENVTEKQAPRIEDKVQESCHPSSGIGKQEILNYGVFRQETASSGLERLRSMPAANSQVGSGKYDPTSNEESLDHKGINARVVPERITTLADASAYINTVVRALKSTQS